MINVVRMVDHEPTDTRLAITSDGRFIPFSMSSGLNLARHVEALTKGLNDPELSNSLMEIPDDDAFLAVMLREGEVVYTGREH